MRLLHGVLLTPRALHNTARFRWMKRCMVEMLFTIMYMVNCYVEGLPLLQQADICALPHEYVPTVLI